MLLIFGVCLSLCFVNCINKQTHIKTKFHNLVQDCVLTVKVLTAGVVNREVMNQSIGTLMNNWLA